MYTHGINNKIVAMKVEQGSKQIQIAVQRFNVKKTHNVKQRHKSNKILKTSSIQSIKNWHRNRTLSMSHAHTHTKSLDNIIVSNGNKTADWI